jgi:hypothetical protein
MLFLVADALTLAWVGMWLGLLCKGRIRAILGSLTLVLFIPAILVMMIEVENNFFITNQPRLWQKVAPLFVPLLCDAALLLWVLWYLPKNFRRLALRR